MLHKDDETSLAIEMAKSGNKFDKFLRLVGISNKGTILHAAVETKAVNCLRYLVGKVTSEVDLDSPDENGMTCLHHLVDLGCHEPSSKVLKLAKILLSNGACVNSRDKYGNTPVHYLAIKCNKVEPCASESFLQLVNLFLQHKYTDLSAKNSCNYTIIEKLPEVDESYSDRSYFTDWIIKQFVAMHNKCAEKKLMDDSFRFRLTGCVVSGKYEELEKCIMKKILNEEFRFQNWYVGSKPILHYIVKHLSSECVKKSIENGLDPWTSNIDDEKLVLHTALTRGHHTIVSSILKGMEYIKGRDVTELSFSLLQAVICNSGGRNHFGQETSRTDHNKCLKLLLNSKLNLDVNQRKSFLNLTTALSLAIKSSNKIAVGLLRDSGGDISAFRFISGT